MFENQEKIYEILSKENGVQLGKNIFLPKDKRGNINCLVMAGSGAGKTSAFTLPNILRKLGSYIVLDPLGEIYDRTNNYMKKNGYMVKTINIVNSLDNYNYDPIKHIESDIDIEILSEILIESNNNNRDPFWDDSSKLFIQTIISYIIEKEERKECRTLCNLLSEEKEKLIEKLEAMDSNSKVYNNIKIMKMCPEKTYQSIISTAYSKIEFMVNKYNKDISFDEHIDFDELYNKKTIFYVSFDQNSKYDQKLANVFISQVMSQLRNRDNIKEYVYFILDDIYRIGKIQNLENEILTARSRKLSFSLCTYSINLLERVYGDQLQIILGTIDTQLFLGTNIQADIDYFSEISELEKGTLKHLDNSNLIVYEKGLKPILAEKDYYFNHNEWI